MVYYELHVVAKLLGKKVRTIRYWVQTGRIKAIKNLTGYRWLVSQEEINRIREEMDNANKNRKYSGRAEKGKAMGMLDRTGQDSEGRS